MRVAVVGAGGVGGMLASLRALRADGLTLKTLEEGEPKFKVRAPDDPGGVGSVDPVWFCVKTYPRQRSRGESPI